MCGIFSNLFLLLRSWSAAAITAAESINFSMSVPNAPQVLGRYEAVDLDSSGQPKPLGSGSFGSVWRYKDTQSREHVAIKRMKLTGLNASQVSTMQKYLGSELLNHAMLHHPHVVKLKDVFLTESHINIVLELAAGGMLFDLVRDTFKAKQHMDEGEARHLFQQLVVTMDYFHTKGVAHRDIKLENTLVQSCQGIGKPIIKVADFGASKYDTTTAYTRVGTPDYMSPEVLLAAPPGTGYDPKKADIWSAGVMLFTMLTGRYPFDAKSHVEQLRLMTQRPLQLPSRISPGCKSLIERLLHPNPAERLTIEQVKEDPWFRHGLPAGALEMASKHLNKASPCDKTREQLEDIIAQALEILQRSN